LGLHVVTASLPLSYLRTIASFCARVLDQHAQIGLGDDERSALAALALQVSGPVSGAHPLNKVLEARDDTATDRDFFDAFIARSSTLVTRPFGEPYLLEELCSAAFLAAGDHDEVKKTLATLTPRTLVLEHGRSKPITLAALAQSHVDSLEESVAIESGHIYPMPPDVAWRWALLDIVFGSHSVLTVAATI
jgi:hypothetical protein